MTSSEVTYKLINPYIEGDFMKSFSSTTPSEAASAAWEKMSKFFANNVPKFAFTLEDENKKLHDFVVKESKNEDGMVKYKIAKTENKMNEQQKKQFKDKLNKFVEQKKLKGGKKHRHDNDDSSSSDTDDVFKMLKYRNGYSNPYYWWWYDPLIYNVNSLYIPTFVATVMPYIEISTIGYNVYV